MKKLLLAFGVIAFGALSTKAQVLFSENFEGGSIPSTWSQTSADTTSDGWNWGAAAALSSTSWTIPAHTNMLATNDDGCNCNKSNDFLISPSYDLSGQTSVGLRFELFFFEGTYQGATESFNVEVSTNGGSSWTVLQTIDGAGSWRSVMINLSAYAGQANVKIGFRYNDGSGWTFGAAIDDFEIYVPPTTDMSAIFVVLPTFAAVGTNVTVAGEMTNLSGQTVTSMTLNYSVDGGTPVTQNLTGLSIPGFGGTYAFSHGTPWIAAGVGPHTIEAWATNINGNADQNTANDKAGAGIIVVSQSVSHVACIEEFTSSTCAPCATFNSTFDPLLNDNNANNSNGPGSSVAAVKYQMNWPNPGNDPSYNPDGATRRTYYGVTGIPYPLIDGAQMEFGNQAEIDEYVSKPSPMALNCTYSVNGGFVGVNVSLTPYFSTGTGNKLFIAVLEKEYDFAASTTSQDVFKHVMRKMLPNGSGITINSFADGVMQSFNQSYNFNTVAPGATPTQGSYNLWVGPSNLEVVAFVQNTATGEIYQAAIGTKVAGMKEASSDLSIGLFPNPVNDMMVVSLELQKSEEVKIEFVNALGQVVLSQNEGTVSGSRNVRINTVALANGVYFARVTAGESVKTVKFNVAH